MTKSTNSKWYVYILQCADKTLYTGITNNLDKRVATHNGGTASKYTRARLPVKVIYSERKRKRSTALRREAEIKRFTRQKKLSLIRESI
ncbi:MAG: GIY-YIG nuclease family protein [Deltaproteobacteria bacterium]|jgi:putative endonuclease|nr:GIY-YIG nuclease family protein [Deltaproteobacteria bacterium]